MAKSEIEKAARKYVEAALRKTLNQKISEEEFNEIVEKAIQAVLLAPSASAKVAA